MRDLELLLKQHMIEVTLRHYSNVLEATNRDEEVNMKEALNYILLIKKADLATLINYIVDGKFDDMAIHSEDIGPIIQHLTTL